MIDGVAAANWLANYGPVPTGGLSARDRAYYGM